MHNSEQIVKTIDSIDRTIRDLIRGTSDLNISSLLQDIAVSDYINYDCSYDLIEFVKRHSNEVMDTVKVLEHKYNKGSGINFITWHKVAEALRVSRRSDMSKQAKIKRIKNSLKRNKLIAETIIGGIV